MSRAEAIECVLRNAGAGHPLRVPEIAESLVKTYGFRPLPDRSQDKKTFNAMRRRPDKFVRTGRGLWTLLEFVPAEQRNGIVTTDSAVEQEWMEDEGGEENE